MTQIIAAITKDYALLASDRRLTRTSGPDKSKSCDEDTCKLVSLCNLCGIGYTGLGFIEGKPTHEWIAHTLLAQNCKEPGMARSILAERATQAFRKSPQKGYRHTFLFAGWGLFLGFGDPPLPRPHFALVTNYLDDFNRPLANPMDVFQQRFRALPDFEKVQLFCVGADIPIDRARTLVRNFDQLAERNISPRAALRLLSEEIINTSANNNTVGSKVLGFCIPKPAVEDFYQTGSTVAVATLPDQETVAFTYFEAGYSKLQQVGPTFVCGNFAGTNFKFENDPATNTQSASFIPIILDLP